MSERRRNVERASLATRDFWVKEHFYELYKTGQKTLEVRVGFPNVRRNFVRGTTLRINADNNCKRTIVDIRTYKKLGDLEENEDFTKIDPTKSPDELRALAAEFLPRDKVRQFGILVFEVQ